MIFAIFIIKVPNLFQYGKSPTSDYNDIKVKTAVEAHGGNDVLESGNDTINSNDV